MSVDIDEHRLVEMVSRKVRLKRIGRDWRGLCPFHTERNPSFAVYRDRKSGQGRFYCFSCGAGGNAVRWMLLMEGKTLREALGERDDPELRSAQEGARRYEEARGAVLRRYRDYNQDCSVPDWAIDTTKPYNSNGWEIEW